MDNLIESPETSEKRAKEKAENLELNLGNEIDENKNKLSIPSINTNKAANRIPEESKNNEKTQEISEANRIGNDEKEFKEKENLDKEPEINFKNISDIKEKKEENKNAKEEEEKKEDILIEKSEIEKEIDPQEILDFFDDTFGYYFHDEIGTFSDFLKSCLNVAKEYFDECVEDRLKDCPLKKGETKPTFDYEKYSNLILDKIYDKLKASYPEGILSFIFEEPPDNKLTTCFLIVLKADNSFFEKYNIDKDLLDPSNKNTKNLFKAKGIQTRFNEMIEERKAELNKMRKEKDFKENMKKLYGTFKIEEIIEKEKEGFLKEILLDYKDDRKLMDIINKLKPDIFNMKLIQSIDHVVDKPNKVKKEEEKKQEASKIEEKDKPISPDNINIELVNLDKQKKNEPADMEDNKNQGTIKNDSKGGKKLIDEKESLKREVEHKALEIKEKPQDSNEKKNLDKTKTIKHDEKVYDSKKERVITIEYINKIEKLFEIFDSNLKTIIRNYIAIYVKKISEQLKKKNPKKFKQELKESQKYTKKTAKDGGFAGYLFNMFKYYVITFEDFLYLFLKILNFTTGLKIKLELQENKDIFIRLFFLEESYKYPADYLGYKLQLKPYSKVYEKFYQICNIKDKNKVKEDIKNKAEESKKDELNAVIANEGEKEKLIDNNENKDNLVVKKNLKQAELQQNLEEHSNLINEQKREMQKELIIDNKNVIEEEQEKNKKLNLNEALDNNQNEVILLGNGISQLIQEKKEENISRNKLMELKKSKELMKEFLRQKFEVDEVDLDDQHFFPPYVPIDYDNEDKFRKYVANDDIHECAKEEQYKLWVNLDDYQSSDDEEEDEEEEEENENKSNQETKEINENKIFDVEKDFPCEDCFYYRNIDRLRIISSAIDEVVNLNELANCEDFYKDVLLINNYKAYEEKTTAKFLIFKRLNVYSDKAQGELIRLFRNFFGEKISFYFLWYSFLLKYIVILMIMSSCFFVLTMFDYFKKSYIFKTIGFQFSSLDAMYIIYSLLVGIWSTLLMKAWKSKESLYAYIWGCDNFQTDEPFRDEFKYDEMTTFVFTKRVPVQKGWKKTLKKFISGSIILCLCFLSFWIMYGIFRIKDPDILSSIQTNISNSNTTNSTNSQDKSRFELEIFNDKYQNEKHLMNISNRLMQLVITSNESSAYQLKNEDKNDPLTLGILDNIMPTLVGIIIGLQIEIMSSINLRICKYLTNFENHEKNSIYEESYVTKLLFFEFVNNFISMFYISFVKPFLSKCNSNDCLKELQLQVYCVLLVRIIWRLLFIFLKYLQFKFKTFAYLLKKKKTENIKFINQSEHHQLNCTEYNSYLEDFNQTIIFFGFLMLFSSTCPLTPLLVFVLAFLNKNYDAFKLFNFYKLSKIEKSDGIGIYNDFLKLFYYIGILLNVGIVLFSNTEVQDIPLYIRFGIFLGFINLLLIIFYLINIDLHPNWFNNLYLFQNEFTKKYYERPGPKYYHQDFIKDPTKKKKIVKKQEKQNNQNNEEYRNNSGEDKYNYDNSDSYEDYHHDDNVFNDDSLADDSHYDDEEEE